MLFAMDHWFAVSRPSLLLSLGTQNRLRGARQLGWASGLASAGRVALAGGTTLGVTSYT